MCYKQYLWLKFQALVNKLRFYIDPAHLNICSVQTKMPSESEVAQLCPTLCDPMDCSPPGSSVHGIFQVRLLEWGAISFSRGSSQSRDRTRVSHRAGRRFTVWATREWLSLHTKPIDTPKTCYWTWNFRSERQDPALSTLTFLKHIWEFSVEKHIL